LACSCLIDSLLVCYFDACQELNCTLIGCTQSTQAFARAYFLGLAMEIRTMCVTFGNMGRPFVCG
jgi:hypothetical protein